MNKWILPNSPLTPPPPQPLKVWPIPWCWWIFFWTWFIFRKQIYTYELTMWVISITIFDFWKFLSHVLGFPSGPAGSASGGGESPHITGEYIESQANYKLTLYLYNMICMKAQSVPNKNKINSLYPPKNRKGKYIISELTILFNWK